ncbi:MAG: PD40 domain-containing protein [Sedimentisphaerales bacterium]|nr:PD40 domain-containing protein [Sedimentisphaerales bacterium]
MTGRVQKTLVGMAVCGGVVVAGFLFSARESGPVEPYVEVAVGPRISPDYADLVIPANIAPLNFRVLEEGRRYFARIHGNGGAAIEVFSRNGDMRIAAGPWRRLLGANRGKRICCDVYIQDAERRWHKFRRISNTVAEDDIDAYVVYRLMKPIYTWWKDVGIYQRRLAEYDESVVMHGRSFEEGCLNCHSFVAGRPETMTIGLRSATYGSSTLLVRDGAVDRIGAKWGYTAWHPSGRLAVYSMNNVIQFFHTGRMEVRDVLDLDSALACYHVEERKVVCPAPLARKDRLETYPAWSPDGEHLYFCSAPIPWTDRQAVPPENYDKVKYDLCRVRYDVQTDRWGDVETVLSAEETGLSILLPRISPDGRFLLFCMCDYGCFPVHQPSSDLYLMDFATQQYRRLDINSAYSESWHSWSSNGRWMAFSSRAQGGLFTRTYLSYVDRDGRAHKPFVLPQRDPRYYESQLQTYSVPELVTGRVEVSRTSLARAARSEASIAVDIPITAATPKAPETAHWQERE